MTTEKPRVQAYKFKRSELNSAPGKSFRCIEPSLVTKGVFSKFSDFKYCNWDYCQASSLEIISILSQQHYYHRSQVTSPFPYKTEGTMTLRDRVRTPQCGWLSQLWVTRASAASHHIQWHQNKHSLYVYTLLNV